MNAPLKYTLLSLLSVVAVGVLALPDERCCGQGVGLFDIPKSKLTKVEPPEGCARASERALAILPEVEKEIEEPLKAAMREAVANKDKDETPAEAWDAAGTLALLNVHPAASLWAELNALKAEWRSEFVVQAGVYLALLDHDDDAKVFLHCAYDSGNRSPYLLEALANIYRKGGDKPKAVQFIGEAQQNAPDDEIIQLEKAMFNTGRPPAPQSAADPVDAALAEFKRHTDLAVLAVKRQEELRAQVERAYFGEIYGEPEEAVTAWRKTYDEMIESLKEPARMAKLTKEQIQQQNPTAPDSMRTMYRNTFFYTVMCLYIGVSNDMLSQARRPTITEGFDVAFWSDAMGMEPVEYARVIRSLRDFKFKEIALNAPGYYFEDWGGVQFKTFYTYAGDVRRDQYALCAERNRGNLAAEDACKFEVDKKYCATVRQLHKDWMDETEALTQRLGRRFDRTAAGVLARAGDVADDAFIFASTYAKAMNVRPDDEMGKEWVMDLNKRYHDLVAQAVGDGDGGPAALLRHEAETYRSYKDNAESSIGQYKQGIEETCQPVDQRALEQLLEEQRRAVSAMLWERLIRDLNVSWNPNANCTLSAGKWFSVTVDIDGGVKFGGKWSPYKKAFDGSPTFDINQKFKFDVKDGRYVAVTFSSSKSQSGGIFTGTGGVTVSAQYDSKTGKMSVPVNVSTKLGLGYKKKVGGQEYGIVCYPGDLSAKFDARSVAKDAMDYMRSLKR